MTARTNPRSRTTLLVVLSLLAAAFVASRPAPVTVGAQTARPDFVRLSRVAPAPVIAGKARKIGLYDQHQMLPVVIGLQPPHEAREEQVIKGLMTPRSPTFHHWYTPSTWNARFAPSARSEQAAVSWLKSQGISIAKRWPDRIMINTAGTVATFEKAFKVQINRYRVGARTFFAPDRQPTIPAALAGIVTSMAGLDSYAVTHPEMSGGRHPLKLPIYSSGPMRSNLGSAHHNGDPAKLPRALRAILARSSHGSAKAGLAEVLSPVHRSAAHLPHSGRSPAIRPDFTNGYYDPTDIYSSNAYGFDALQALGHCCNPLDNPTTSSPVQSSVAIAGQGAISCCGTGTDIDGWFNQYGYLAEDLSLIGVDGTPACCSDEVTLDTEWSNAMSNSFGSYTTTAHQYIYEGGHGTIGDLATVFNQMYTDNYARNASTSFGATESVWGSFYSTLHSTFDNMVGVGWSIAVAAGDHGAYDSCTSGSPDVDYPSSDPDVVSAGGTELGLYSNGSYASEVAWTGSSCDSNNNGGGGGGCSSLFSTPPYQTASGFSNGCSNQRSVPDVSLNAYYGQNYYFNGGLHGVGGTSIVAPELAGFFAQVNSYLLNEGSICGGSPGTSACSPFGNPNYAFYNAVLGNGVGKAPNDPFYDITSGCNSNVEGPGYCAGTGYDLATGWGSFNANELARAVVWQAVVTDNGRPSVTLSGPTTSTWYRSDQTVGVSVADTGDGGSVSGMAGFSDAWDSDPGDPSGEATPGCCNTFWNGPAHPNGTSDTLHLDSNGQGCHTVNVEAWDNMGYQSGDQTYGPLCYDTIAPYTTSITFAPTSPSNSGSVTIYGAAADPGCGSTGSCVQSIGYYVNTATDGNPNDGSWQDLGNVNGSSNSISWNTSGYADGTHPIAVDPTDNAGNFSSCIPPEDQCSSFLLDRTAPSTTLDLNGAAPSAGPYLRPVTVTLSASDPSPGSGVAHTYYSINGGATQTYTAPVTINTAGNYTVTYYSTDHAGNTESTSTASFSVVSTVTAKAGSPTVVYGQDDVTTAWWQSTSSLCNSGPPNPYCKKRLTYPIVTCTYSPSYAPAISATGLTTARAGAPAGTYPTSCWGAYDPSYPFTYASGTLTVNPAPLTVKPVNAVVTRGDRVPTLDWRADFVNHDTAQALSKQPVCVAKVRVDRRGRVISAPGIYRIRCHGAKDPNYWIRYAIGKLRVTR